MFEVRERSMLMMRPLMKLCCGLVVCGGNDVGCGLKQVRDRRRRRD